GTRRIAALLRQLAGCLAVIAAQPLRPLSGGLDPVRPISAPLRCHREATGPDRSQRKDGSAKERSEIAVRLDLRKGNEFRYALFGDLPVTFLRVRLTTLPAWPRPTSLY